MVLAKVHHNTSTKQRLSCFGTCFHLQTTHNNLRAGSHGVSSPRYQLIGGQYVESQSLRAWKLGLTTSHMVPSMTWMPTWQHFMRGEVHDLC